MTNRDSDELCLPMGAPLRTPQHAAPLRFRSRVGSAGQVRSPGRARRLTRQIRRLLITTFAWATGLGLVAGAITIFAIATDPAHLEQGGESSLRQSMPYSAPSGGDAGAGASHSGRTHSGVAAGSRGYRLLATFSGRGGRTTKHFNVRARHTWQLRWAYRCAPQAGAGQFTLLRADVAADQPTFTTSIDETAASGHGTALLTATGRRQYLVVISACSWHVDVSQAR